MFGHSTATSLRCGACARKPSGSLLSQLFIRRLVRKPTDLVIKLFACYFTATNGYLLTKPLQLLSQASMFLLSHSSVDLRNLPRVIS